MARNKKSKTKLLSEKEIERTESGQFSKLSDEAQECLEKIFTESFNDLLSMAVVDYIDTHKAYEYDDSWEYLNPEDESCGLTCLGEISPANYETISDFLHDYNGELDEDYRWGKTFYTAQNIEQDIESWMIDAMHEQLEDYIQDFYTKQLDYSDWIFQEVTIRIEQTRLRTSTQEEFVQTITQTEDVPLGRSATLTELRDFFEDYFDSFDGFDINNHLYEWVSELWKEPFHEFYLRGCELLETSISSDYKVLRYTNQPVEQLFLDYLTDWLVIDNCFRKSLIPQLPKAFDYQTHQILQDHFKSGEVLSIRPLLKNLITDGLRDVVLKINEQPIDKILKLMAAIYAEQFNILSPTPICYQVDELRDLLRYTEIKENFFKKGLEYCYQTLYPELQMRDTLINVLPTHPKDYFPHARQMKRHFVLHVGETNTGKTYQALQRLKQSNTGVYLAPLRLLALEVQERLMKQGCLCHLLTGEEEVIVPNAQHTSCTIEKLDFHQAFDLAVIDEAQMIGDATRGYAWTHAILGVCASEIHICLAPHALALIQQLIELCQDTFEVVEHIRSSDLTASAKRFNFVEETRPGDALVVFSKRKVLNVSAKLMKETDLSCSLLYGALPYQSRAKQFQDFSTGKTQVLVTTDAIGMGVNLPIKRVIFLEDSKFDGSETRKLNTSELKQIGGRAGRKGIYDVGEVIFPHRGLLNSFNEEIPPLEVAPMGITPDLLTIPDDLLTIVKGWQELSFETPFVRTLIDEPLNILQRAVDAGLSKQEQYKAMFLPVNLQQTSQVSLLEDYFEHLRNGVRRLPFPEKPALQYGDTLRQLEEYYKLLDLYYAMSRTYQLQYESDALTHERLAVSDSINKQLLSEELQVATCNQCGREMAWDAVHYKCDHCYNMNRYSYYDYDDEDDWEDEDWVI